MTNFGTKYVSKNCVSKIARETDLEIKIAKNTQTSLRKAMRFLFCLHNTIDVITTKFEHVL